jgi:hypothetical protein
MSTDVSEVHAASIIRAMITEAARTSETSVDIQLRTWQYIPEDSGLQNFESLFSMCVVTTYWFQKNLASGKVYPLKIRPTN